MTSMNIDSSNSSPATVSWSKRLFVKFLGQLEDCAIELREGTHVTLLGKSNADLSAIITIHNAKAYKSILWGGSIGAAEAYVEGLWSTDDLTTVIRIFSRNLAKLQQYEQRFSFLSNVFNRLSHSLNSNSKNGSRTNIAAHYDLSNAMYRLFLDPHMQYSSGMFPQPDSSLEQAQEHKMALICEHLQLDETDHLLEVGTGWGGLACYAAKRYGCKVTTTTISPAQYEVAQERVQAQGLQKQVTLLLEDYRDLNGEYSKIVSVEMIEAVGHKYMPTYFRKLNDLLKPGGKLLLQAITINDQRYNSYRTKVDFIQKYIFPGGHLPSLGVICQQQQHTQLYIDHLADYRLNYANTLKIWRERFLHHRQDILTLGFSDDFIRLWEFYFCYCEGAFREKVIGLAHIGFVKSHY